MEWPLVGRGARVIAMTVGGLANRVQGAHGLPMLRQMTLSTQFSLRAGRVAGTLAVIAAVLVVVHVLAMQAVFNDSLGLKERFGLHYWQLAFFDLDEEESFGTWFSAVMLLLAGGLLLTEAMACRGEQKGWQKWWLALGIGFCFLSVDEVVGMHELLNTLMGGGSWTHVGFWILGGVGVAFLPFLWHYRWRTALLFLLAGAIYGGGAVGVEHWTDSAVNSLHYNMWTALEEGMEMAGVIVLVYAMLDYLRGTSTRLVRLEVHSVDAT